MVVARTCGRAGKCRRARVAGFVGLSARSKRASNPARKMVARGASFHRGLAIVAFLVLVCYVRAALATPTIRYIDQSATGCAGSGCADTNDGMTKTTAWFHAPGMNGVTCGVGPGAIDCGSGAYIGGTTYANWQFIFRGGVDYHVYATWTWREFSTGSGCSPIGCDSTPDANNVYVGVDPTWYVGGSWTRPIMDCGGAANCVAHPAMLQLAPHQGAVFDNFEWTGYYWSNSHADGTFGDCLMNMGSGAAHNEFENMYGHGWSHAGFTAGVNGDNGNMFCSATGQGDVTTYVHNNVLDGADTAKDSFRFSYGGVNFAYNYIQFVENCVITVDNPSYHDNVCNMGGTSNTGENADFDSSQHQNCYEDNGSHVNSFLYNNVCLNDIQGALGFWLAPNVGETTFDFNNQFLNPHDQANIHDNGVPVLSGGVYTPTGQGYGPAGFIIVFNDTIECGPDGGPPAALCVGCDDGSFHTISANFSTSGTNSSGASSVTIANSGATFVVPPGNSMTFTIAGDSTRYYFKNTSNVTVTGSGGTATIPITPNLSQNETAATSLATGYGEQGCTFANLHLITSGTGVNPIAATYPSQTLATNLVQTLAMANGQGYSLGEAFSFSSPSPSGATVKAGTNEQFLICSVITTLNATAGAACAHATTYGVVYNATPHTVSAPALVAQSRPSMWDIGAYQFSGGISLPPLNLSLSAH
jgi:hypothetical protein